jgi:hypothetical protein
LNPTRIQTILPPGHIVGVISYVHFTCSPGCMAWWLNVFSPWTVSLPDLCSIELSRNYPAIMTSSMKIILAFSQFTTTN